MRKRYWGRLPWDGIGWGGRFRTELSDLRQWAAAEWRRGFPAALRQVVRIADRLGWPLAALGRTIRFSRARGLPFRAAARLYCDCVASGGDPMEVHVWRALRGDRHPLPARSAARLLSRLGDPAAHRLLADKLALAERLATAGIAVPRLHLLCRRGDRATRDLINDAATGAGLFVKPRHGKGGQGAFAVTWSADGWLVDGAPMPADKLIARLDSVLTCDDMLVQARLVASDALADLAPDGRAPVLRLATARLPGQAPFLHSALLVLAQPGRNPRNFLHGAVFAPIDCISGRVAHGVALGQPLERLEHCGGAAAPLAGRPIPDFDAAAALALRAMAEVPPLPLIHWDVIVTPSGPVVIEGNSAGNWILASLPGFSGLEACPLPPILALWRDAPAERREQN